MGHELSPEDPLFEVVEGIAAPAVMAPVERAEPISEDILDIGLDLDELTAEMESEGAGHDLGLELGLEFGNLEEEPKPAAGAAEEEAEVPYEFDLDLGAEEEPGEEAAHEFELDLGAEEEPGKEAAPEFELDLGPEAAAEEVAEEETGFEFELGEMKDVETLDFGLETAAETEATEETAGLELADLEDFDFGDLGLETAIEEGAPEAGKAEEELSLDMSELESPAEELVGTGEFGDLGDLDEEGLLSDSEEIATKLDLAQAYIEMGDNEGARSRLEEVAETGTDEQKLQAQELLAKI
jgi:pilus assembly protein FimV